MRRLHRGDDPAAGCREAEHGQRVGREASADHVGLAGEEEEQLGAGFTFSFSLISTLSVTTGNDNRLIIADKSPIPADKDV